MNTRPIASVVLAAYGVAIAVFAVALFAGLAIGGRPGLEIARLLASASLILIAGATIRWGAQRGYAIVAPGTGVNITNLLRSLLMIACVVPILALLGTPVFWIVFRFVHRT